MKSLPFYAPGFYAVVALAFGLGLARCEAQPPTDNPATVNPAMTRAEFDTRWNFFYDKGDWVGLRQLGRDWQAAHPEDSVALFAQGLTSYMLGDLDFTIAEYEKLIAIDPAAAGNYTGTLAITRTVRRNYPDLQLQPLEFKAGDAALEQIQWQRKGAALLTAKRYDEIEKTAAELQKSNAANVRGLPHLRSFFEGLVRRKSADFGKVKSQIAVWRAARPQSNLAR